MIFNSIDFAIFLPLVFALYWLFGSKRIQYQNILLLASSYIFYGWWDWRFLGLIALSTLLDYYLGIAIYNSPSKHIKRKALLIISIAINLGGLMFFKYFDFFISNFNQAFSFFGQAIPINNLNIILPVGISFYTFQTLSYTIDVYRNKLPATKNLIHFGAFVSFFPQLVAGPIERAKHLLPQFKHKRVFNKEVASDGLRQILWGFSKSLSLLTLVLFTLI